MAFGAPLSDLVAAPFGEADVAELLVLQRCCWVQEAIANQSLGFAALHESAADVLAWAQIWTVLCVRRCSRLVAAVRARATQRDWEIGRLMVAPDLQGHGVGRWLLAQAERLAPEDTERLVLISAAGSARNIRRYARSGYTVAAVPANTGEDVAGTILLVKTPIPRSAGG